MEGGIELADIINNASTEFLYINDELGIQTEKLKGVQQKLGLQKQTLQNNSLVLKKLKESTKITRIVKVIFCILMVFSALFVIAKYADFTVTFKRLIPENWTQFKQVVLNIKPN